jgi:hypothetical protein
MLLSFELSDKANNELDWIGKATVRDFPSTYKNVLRIIENKHLSVYLDFACGLPGNYRTEIPQKQ